MTCVLLFLSLTNPIYFRPLSTHARQSNLFQTLIYSYQGIQCFKSSFIHRRESNASNTHLYMSGHTMLQTLTLTLNLGHNPLTLTPIYKTYIYLRLTHPHITFLLYYFVPSLQTQTLCHICFSILCLLHNMSSTSAKWLVHYDGNIIKTNERDTFQSPHPLFFETK